MPSKEQDDPTILYNIQTMPPAEDAIRNFAADTPRCRLIYVPRQDAEMTNVHVTFETETARKRFLKKLVTLPLQSLRVDRREIG